MTTIKNVKTIYFFISLLCLFISFIYLGLYGTILYNVFDNIFIKVIFGIPLAFLIFLFGYCLNELYK